MCPHRQKGLKTDFTKGLKGQVVAVLRLVSRKITNNNMVKGMIPTAP